MILKKVFKILTLFIIIIISCCISFGCNFVYDELEPDGGYKHPNFETVYSKEEHIDRIWDLTVERFKQDFDNCKIKNLFVDIVYAFYDDDPEYFLVEIEYFEEFTNKGKFHYGLGSREIEITTKFIHTIGYIYKDNYYSSQAYNAFYSGKSAYSTYASREYKKYYGNVVQAVLIDGKLIQLYHSNCLDVSYPEIHNSNECWQCKDNPYQNKEVDETKLKHYMEANYQMYTNLPTYPFSRIK